MLDRILDAATDNLRFAKILVQMGLDPNNVTWDAMTSQRLLENLARAEAIIAQNKIAADAFPQLTAVRGD